MSPSVTNKSESVCGCDRAESDLNERIKQLSYRYEIEKLPLSLFFFLVQ